MIEFDRRVGAFGTVRVFKRTSDGARLYCIGASIQTMAAADGVSLFGYVHAAKLLLGAAREASIYLGVAVSTLKSWRAKKIGPKWTHRGARLVCHFPGDLDAFLQRGARDPDKP